MKLARRFALIAPLAATLLLSSPAAARADIYTNPPGNLEFDAYMQTLDKHGVTYRTRQDAINAGMLMCMNMEFDAATPDQVISEDGEHRGFSGDDSATMLGAAAAVLCPDQGPAVRRWIDSNR